MSNVLKMTEIQKIHALLSLGWSQRRVARELHLSRTTVAAYAKSCPANCAISIPGSGAADSIPAEVTSAGSEVAEPVPLDQAKSAITISGTAGRKSHCAGLEEVIAEKLELGLSGQRIYQDLREDLDFQGSYSSIRRFLQRRAATAAVPFRRIERAPGEEAQVDFGQGGLTARTGRQTRRRPWLLRLVLSFSRKGYTEVVWHQTTDDLIRCLENGFAAFGGVPKTLVIDNLKAAVLEADWFDPTLTPKFQSFASHCGFVILPSKPYTPRHKGKVESGVNYAQENAIKGRIFDSLEEQNRFLVDWERATADLRIHGTTRKQVRALFEDQEKHALQPLPVERFPLYREGQRSVHTDGHVSVAKSYYSTPPEFTNRSVWVQWDGRIVRIFDQRHQQIAVHVSVPEGTFSTHPEHIPEKKISAAERGTRWYLDKALRIGPNCGRLGEAIIESRGMHGIRVLQGLVSMGSKYEWRALERAASLALKHGHFRLKVIRRLLETGGGEVTPIEFEESHALIRDPAEYGALIGDAFESTPVR